ncbi:hypothetical protein EDD99_5056 [Streptomyces sp. 846.5]|nr:hypothetical protein EDD99_5056 [Streptomyces sp. 846.5]
MPGRGGKGRPAARSAALEEVEKIRDTSGSGLCVWWGRGSKALLDFLRGYERA